MIETIILIIIISIIIILLIIHVKYGSCVIDDSLYSEFVLFVQYLDLLIDDVYILIESYGWIGFELMEKLFIKNYEKINILRTIRNNYQYLPVGYDSAKQYLLYIHNIPVTENISNCKNIIRLVNSIPNVVNAYIHCTSPHITTPLPQKSKTLKCIIPLLVSIDSGLIVDETSYNFNKINGFIIVKCPVSVWNNTDFNRYILVIDFFDQYKKIL